jgi:predicted DNA-binding protein
MTEATVEMFSEIVHKVDDLSKHTGQPREYYVSELLEHLEYLDAKRRLYDLAADRLDDLKSGRTVAIPIAEVMREYGMEN